MKHRYTFILAAAMMGLGGSTASAQYYQIANQLPQLIRPALTGGFNYKGYVEAGYVGGVGDKKADFIDISTSQGFRYAEWFYMGVGAGVDVLMSHTDDSWGNGWHDAPGYDDYYGHGTTKTAVMIPLFTDFRFNIGNSQGSMASMFIDLRVGASFLMGDDYVSIGNGYLTRSECFYLKPTIGIRIPLGSSNVKQALNIGVTYQLLTQNYWSRYNNNSTLSAFGASIGFEW